MNKDLKSIDVSALPELLTQSVRKLSRYKVLLFVLFVASIYGFIGYRIFTLSSATPGSEGVQSEVTSLTPRIDITVVEQLQSLQDNSVNVQTLFDEARNSPFSE